MLRTSLAGTLSLLMVLAAVSGADLLAQQSGEEKAIDVEPVLSPKSGQFRALLIGVDDYVRLKDLKFCEADVTALRDRLVAMGFQRDTIKCLTTGDADPAHRPNYRNITERLDALFAGLDKDSVLVIALSGHGGSFESRNKEGNVLKSSFFCPQDARVGDPHGTMVPVKDIYDRLDKCPARFKMLLVDACRDPHLIPTDTPGIGRSAIDEAKSMSEFSKSFSDGTLPKGTIALISCASGEQSYEDPNRGHGIFMHYLLDGLAGRADAVYRGDRDGRVSYRELKDYVYRKTSDHAWNTVNRAQTPNFYSAWELPNFDLVNVRADSPQSTASPTWVTVRGTELASHIPDLERTSVAYVKITDATSAQLYQLLRIKEQLRGLDLSGNLAVQNLEPLEELRQLTWLDLSGCCYISDYTPLSHMKHLETLSLRRTYDKHYIMSDLSFLSELKNLRSLDLGYCRSENENVLAILPGLSNLSSLNLESWSLSEAECSHLAQLTNLTALHLSSSLADFSALDGMTKLQSLGLPAYTKSQNLHKLRGLGVVSENLHSLDLGTRYSLDLSALAGVTNLRNLVLPSKTTNEQLQWLRDHGVISADLSSLDLSPCRLVTDLTPLAGIGNLESLGLPHSMTNENLKWLQTNKVLSRTLQSLTIQGSNLLTDLSPLKGLSLSELELRYCTEIADLAPLKEMTKLRSLKFYKCNKFTDLAPLAGLTQLSTLSLYECDGVRDLAPLAGLTNLTSLDLSGCGNFKDVTILENMQYLTDLGLPIPTSDKQLKWVVSLPEIRNRLCYIRLRCPELTSIDCLGYLPNLRDFSLTGNKHIDSDSQSKLKEKLKEARR